MNIDHIDRDFVTPQSLEEMGVYDTNTNSFTDQPLISAYQGFVSESSTSTELGFTSPLLPQNGRVYLRNGVTHNFYGVNQARGDKVLRLLYYRSYLQLQGSPPVQLGGDAFSSNVLYVIFIDLYKIDHTKPHDYYCICSVISSH